MRLVLTIFLFAACVGMACVDVFDDLQKNTDALSLRPCRFTCSCKHGQPCDCSGGKCVCKACSCVKREEPATNWPSYEQACAARKSRGIPIVIFVGCTPRNVDRCAVAAEVAFVDCPKPCIVVGTAEGWRYDLPAGATDAEIYVKAFSPPPVQQPVYQQPVFAPQMFAPSFSGGRGGNC